MAGIRRQSSGCFMFVVARRYDKSPENQCLQYFEKIRDTKNFIEFLAPQMRPQVIKKLAKAENMNV